MSEDLYLRGAGNEEVQLSSFNDIGDQLRPSQNKLEKYEKAYLSKAPEIICRGNGVGTKEYIISHPLAEYAGAECVLVRYKKRARKKRVGGFKESFGEYGRRKKGVGVVCRHNSYFDFLKHNTLTELIDFLIDERCSCDHSFGIVLRIPNPEYSGPETKHKNAIYKGVKEMLWSDIRKIRISTKDEIPTGIGLI